VTIVAAVLLGFASGCATDEEHHFPNDEIWESAHFRYHTRSGETGACKAVLQQLERHFELMHAYLGFPWPRDGKVDYYKFLDLSDYQNNAECPAQSGSCTDGSSVFSYYTLMEHELIHAYLAPMGYPPRFFMEGAAVALACEQPYVTLGKVASWRDVVALPPSDRTGVFIEGPWFVGYLLYRYGPELFISLYDRLNNELASADQIAATFELVYGETLDDVWNAAYEYDGRVRCVTLSACNGLPLLLDGSSQSIGMACDGSDNTRTFQLNTETDVVMSQVDVDYYAPVPCDRDLYFAAEGDPVGDTSHGTVASMAPGNYFVGAEFRESGTLGLRALATKALVLNCNQVQTIELDSPEFLGRRDMSVTIPNDGNSWFVKLHVPSNREFWWPKAASNEVEQCVSCADPPDCQSFTGDPQLDPGGNVILRLTPAAPGWDYVMYEFGFKNI